MLDTWEQLSGLYKTCSFYYLVGVKEDQKKLLLFAYILARREKECSDAFPSDTVCTLEELEEYFLKWLYPVSKFVDKMT